MLKRLKTHHLFRRVPLLSFWRQSLNPVEKTHRGEGGEAVEHRLLAVEIIDEGKLHFSSEVSLTPGPAWRA